MSITPKNTKVRTSIYVLKDPESNEIRYVGKTVKKLETRLKQHIYDSKSDRRNKRKNWISKILNGGKIPIIEEVDYSAWDESQEKEIYWIKHYRDLGLDLVNNTDGGEGNLGYVKSKETIEKLKKSLRDNLDPVYQYDLDGNFIKKWNNAPEASESLNIKPAGITRCLRKDRFKYMNFIWSYEYNENPTEVSEDLRNSIKNRQKSNKIGNPGVSHSLISRIIKLEDNYNSAKNIYIFKSKEFTKDNYLYEAISLADAGLWCIENKYSRAKKSSSLKSHISKACLQNTPYVELYFSYEKPDFITDIKSSDLIYLSLIDSKKNYIFKDVLGLNNFIDISKLNKSNVINNMKGVTSHILYGSEMCKVFWKINTEHCRLYKELYGELSDKIEENPTMDNIELIN